MKGDKAKIHKLLHESKVTLPDENSILIGVRCSDMPRLMDVPSVVRLCDECGETVWISETYGEIVKHFLCQVCGIPRMEKEKEWFRTPRNF